MAETVEDLLRRTAYRKIDVDHFIGPERLIWSRFEPDLGYMLVDSVHNDGVDGSLSEYTYTPGGYRSMVNYAGRTCRINTYGDSYTLGHQVSDGETWQEVLAAHLREPIRNYGIGGWSLYTSYLMARRVEPGPDGAEYVVMGIFEDDHDRNLDASRWIRSRVDWKYAADDVPEPITGAPWAHLRFDVKSGRWEKRPGWCRKPEDMRALCDPRRVCEIFKDDEIMRLFLLERGGDVDVRPFEALAEAFGVSVNLRDPATRRADALRLHHEYGFRSTQFLLEEMRAWLEGMGKKLMIMLTYGERLVSETTGGKPRFDQPFLDYMAASGLPWFDSMPVAIEEYRRHNLPLKEFIRLHFVPPSAAAVWNHFTPLMHHKFAFWVKDRIVNWLDPKPPAYRF